MKLKRLSYISPYHGDASHLTDSLEVIQVAAAVILRAPEAPIEEGDPNREELSEVDLIVLPGGPTFARPFADVVRVGCLCASGRQWARRLMQPTLGAVHAYASVSRLRVHGSRQTWRCRQ